MRRVAIPALAAAVLTVAACGGGPGAQSPSGGSKTLVIDTSFNLKTADPGRMYEQTGLMVDHVIYDTLLTFKGSDVTKPVPSLATSYELSEDAKEITLELRDDAKFADGSPVTADDVVFSLERVKGVKGNPSFLLDGVTVKKDGDNKIVLTSEKPNPALPYILPNPALGIVNSKVVKENGGSKDAKDGAEKFLNSQSAGSGPYVLKSFNANTQVELAVNDKYWGTEKPAYNKVVLRNVQAATQKLNVQRGDSQVALDLTADQAGSLSGGLQLTKGPSASVFFLFGNQDKAISKATSNPKFMEAVRKGVDYPGLLQLAGGGAVQAAGVVPSMIPGSLPADQAVKRDVEGAKAALKESGVADPKVSLEYPSDYTLNGMQFQPLAERIQANLKEVGITVDLKPAPLASALENYRKGKEEMGLWWWSPDFPDASNYLAFLPGGIIGERVGWKKGANEQLEADGAKAAVTSDDAERKAMYEGIQTRLNEASPMVPLIQPGQHGVTAASVTGLAFNPVWTVDIAALNAK